MMSHVPVTMMRCCCHHAVPCERSAASPQAAGVCHGGEDQGGEHHAWREVGNAWRHGALQHCMAVPVSGWASYTVCMHGKCAPHGRWLCCALRPHLCLTAPYFHRRQPSSSRLPVLSSFMHPLQSIAQLDGAFDYLKKVGSTEVDTAALEAASGVGVVVRGGGGKGGGASTMLGASGRDHSRVLWREGWAALCQEGARNVPRRYQEGESHGPEEPVLHGGGNARLVQQAFGAIYGRTDKLAPVFCVACTRTTHLAAFIRSDCCLPTHNTYHTDQPRADKGRCDGLHRGERGEAGRGALPLQPEHPAGADHALTQVGEEREGRRGVKRWEGWRGCPAGVYQVLAQLSMCEGLESCPPPPLLLDYLGLSPPRFPPRVFDADVEPPFSPPLLPGGPRVLRCAQCWSPRWRRCWAPRQRRT